MSAITLSNAIHLSFVPLSPLYQKLNEEQILAVGNNRVKPKTNTEQCQGKSGKESHHMGPEGERSKVNNTQRDPEQPIQTKNTTK